MHGKEIKLFKLSLLIKSWQNKDKDQKTSIEEIINSFNKKERSLLALFFFTLPAAIPIPYPPGALTIIGLPILFFAFQILISNDKIYLPNKIKKYKISNDKLILISKKITPKIEKIEQYIKPRYNFMNSNIINYLVGFISLICAVVVLIPMPLTNAIPAISIVIMTIGLLNKDGLITIIGIVTAILGMSLALLAITAGFSIIKIIINKFGV